MKGSTDETVGTSFSQDLLQQARDRTLSVIEEAAAAVKPGMTEDQARSLVQEVQRAAGAPKSWHPPQIRFGANTTLPFGQKGEENPSLKDDDVFFFDLGPIFEGHEGDVGRSFAIGKDAEMKRCCTDAEAIWNEVRERWQSTGETGAELYAFARSRAEARGWMLSLDKANGHRISDFPHAAKTRGSVEDWPAKPAPNRWILEIQIKHPSKPFGAFYEDLLN